MLLREIICFEAGYWSYLLNWTLLDYLKWKNIKCIHHYPTAWAVVQSVLLLICILIGNCINWSCNALALGNIWVIETWSLGSYYPSCNPMQFQPYVNRVALGIKYLAFQGLSLPILTNGFNPNTWFFYIVLVI